MNTQPLRGFRDYYPADQANINYLRATVSKTCRLYGYEEFEGPALESFNLYAAKSSDEIVAEQAFVFDDRGGEQITLRPELTPTLARMIANRQGELVLPIRWWSFGRFWRYERPQKGRLREFYQWNCDTIGDDTTSSEIGSLEVVIATLQTLGLTPADVVIDISDRALINQTLADNNITGDKLTAAFKLLDRLDKLSPDARDTYGRELGLSTKEIETILHLADPEADAWRQSSRLTEIFDVMAAKGLSDWVRPNLGLVRGFTYYTGFVFEVWDRDRQYRALMGGGRYANLVAAVGGQSLSAVGFAMGITPMLLFLESKGLLPAYESPTRACVICLDASALDYTRQIVRDLRTNDIGTIFYGVTTSPGNGIKFASRKTIPYAIVIGSNELREQQVTVKKLTTGEQLTIDKSDIIRTITSNK